MNKTVKQIEIREYEEKQRAKKNNFKYFKPLEMSEMDFADFFIELFGDDRNDMWQELNPFIEYLNTRFSDGCFFWISFVLAKDNVFVKNLEERIDILKKLYPKVTDFLVQYEICYNPVNNRNGCERNIGLDVSFISREEFELYDFEKYHAEDGEWKKVEYSSGDGDDSLYEIECEHNKDCKIDDSDIGNVFIEGSYVEKLELMANYLYYKSTGKTIYEEMAEDNITETDLDYIDFLANENYPDVMRLKRLHRQTLDFFRNVEQNKIHDSLLSFIKYH